MPLNETATKILADMKGRYGAEKGERVFYATANKRGKKPETWQDKESAVAADFAPLNDGGTAEKHPNMPVSTKEVHDGIPVEKEHTESDQKARAIAVDHVVEIPDYYKRLEKLEQEAEAEGVKRADRLLRQLEALPGQHEQELAAATEEANTSLERQRVISELAAGAGGVLGMVPGLNLVLPSHSELRSRAQDALQAKAEEHAANLGDLQQQHADQATQLVNRLRARAAKAASYFVPQSDRELDNQQSGLRWGTIAGALGGGLFNSGTLPDGGALAWQDFLPTLAGAKAGGQAGLLTAGMHRAFTDPILTTESGGLVPASEGHMPGQGWKPLIGTLSGAGLGGWIGHDIGSNWHMGMHDPAGSAFTGTAAGGVIGGLTGAAVGGYADKRQAQDILQARGIKVSIDLTMSSPGMAAAPRGDELHLPMGVNPFAGDPKATSEYENGYSYAQALGHQMLNQATEGDVQRWIGNANTWRQGFADACSKFGLERVGQIVAPQPEKSAAGPVPSALEPAGHWTRGILATLGGVGGGVAAHSLWGDPGELYTLVPPALAGVTAGTVLGDTIHSAIQRNRVPEGAPITGTDDPRVRLPQGLAALGGLAAGAGLGYLGGHYLAPEGWHDTPGGHVPEIVGTSVGGVTGAMAGSALENRLAGRDKNSHYTLNTRFDAEDTMTRIAPMTDDALKTANALYPLIGALGGAAAGALAAPHVGALGDFVQSHHQGAPIVDVDPTGRAGSPEIPRLDAHGAPMHAALTPAELTHLERMYGAGIGGAAGGLGGMLLSPGEEEARRQAPHMIRTAEYVEGEEKIAVNPALAALLGAGLGAAGGGALAHFAPGMSEHLQNAGNLEAPQVGAPGAVDAPQAFQAPHVGIPYEQPGTPFEGLANRGAGWLNSASDAGTSALDWLAGHGTSAGNAAAAGGVDATNSALHTGTDLINQGTHGIPGLLDRGTSFAGDVGGALDRNVPGAAELSRVVGTPTLGGAAIGAGAGGLAGLGYGLASQQDEDEQNPNAAPKLAFRFDVDADVVGSAIDVIQAKLAALGTTLGTLGGIAGGAVLGNYLAPAMHWAAVPGENAAMTHAISQEVQPQLDRMVQNPGGDINVHFTPEQMHALQAGASAARGAEWGGVADVGRIGGAGIGGITGYQLGRGLDETLGLEKKERPLVISPMARMAPNA